MLTLNENLREAAPESYTRARLTPGMALFAYFVLGLLETVVAYFVFDRTDDHYYFLSIANTGTSVVPLTGVEAYDLKAIFAAYVFYWITLPSRLLGGNELTHLLWLRGLTLLGFYAAFEAVKSGSSLARWAPREQVETRRNLFLWAVLLFPAQIAWTASLLRDGISCALLFFAIYLWRGRWKLFALPLLGASLSLRPEFVLVPVCLAGARWIMRYRWCARNPGTCLLLLCVVGSLLCFEPRYASSQFSLAVFTGLAYPDVTSLFDVPGYLAVALQGLIDPLPITNLAAPSAFGMAETIFFLVLLVLAMRALGKMNTNEKARAVASLLLLWFFAYFESFVSSYSRHRIALVVLLMAVVVCSGYRPRYRLKPVRVADSGAACFP